MWDSNHNTILGKQTIILREKHPHKQKYHNCYKLLLLLMISLGIVLMEWCLQPLKTVFLKIY